MTDKEAVLRIAYAETHACVVIRKRQTSERRPGTRASRPRSPSGENSTASSRPMHLHGSEPSEKAVGVFGRLPARSAGSNYPRDECAVLARML